MRYEDLARKLYEMQLADMPEFDDWGLKTTQTWTFEDWTGSDMWKVISEYIDTEVLHEEFK